MLKYRKKLIQQQEILEHIQRVVDNIKADIKNWKYGDIFLVLCETSEKVKKYLFIYNITNGNSKEKEAYLKISDTLPSEINEEFLNNIDTVCTGLTWFENRYYPTSTDESIDDMIKRKNLIEYFPDETGILHTYICRLNINKTFINSLKYIGNFNLQLPKDEFIPWCKGMYPFLLYDSKKVEKFINLVFELYQNNNLKKSKMYNKEYAQKMRKKAKEAFEYTYIIEKKVNQFISNGFKE